MKDDTVQNDSYLNDCALLHLRPFLMPFNVLEGRALCRCDSSLVRPFTFPAPAEGNKGPVRMGARNIDSGRPPK